MSTSAWGTSVKGPLRLGSAWRCRVLLTSSLGEGRQKETEGAWGVVFPRPRSSISSVSYLLLRLRQEFT